MFFLVSTRKNQRNGFNFALFLILFIDCCFSEIGLFFGFVIFIVLSKYTVNLQICYLMGTPFLFRQERGKEARPDPPSSTRASVLAIYVSQPPRGRTVGSGPLLTRLESNAILLQVCTISGSPNTSMGDQFTVRAPLTDSSFLSDQQVFFGYQKIYHSCNRPHAYFYVLPYAPESAKQYHLCK